MKAAGEIWPYDCNLQIMEQNAEQRYNVQRIAMFRKYAMLRQLSVMRYKNQKAIYMEAYAYIIIIL